MGRRKIEIRPIQHERNRAVTFLKRKNGLFKKAYELGVLCSVDVAVIIFEDRPGHQTKLYQYASTSDVDAIVQRQVKFEGESDNKGPADFAQPTPPAVAPPGVDDDDDDDDEERPRKRPRPIGSPVASTSRVPQRGTLDTLQSHMGPEISLQPPSRAAAGFYGQMPPMTAPHLAGPSSSPHLSATSPHPIAPGHPISSDRHLPPPAFPPSGSSTSSGGLTSHYPPPAEHRDLQGQPSREPLPPRQIHYPDRPVVPLRSSPTTPTFARPGSGFGEMQAQRQYQRGYGYSPSGGYSGAPRFPYASGSAGMGGEGAGALSSPPHGGLMRPPGGLDWPATIGGSEGSGQTLTQRGGQLGHHQSPPLHQHSPPPLLPQQPPSLSTQPPSASGHAQHPQHSQQPSSSSGMDWLEILGMQTGTPREPGRRDG